MVENNELVELRPEVAAFAQLMEKKLRIKDAEFPPAEGETQGWKKDKPAELFWRLKQETLELQNEIIKADRYGAASVATTIPFEGADIANFAMMIVDVVSPLVPKKEEVI